MDIKKLQSVMLILALPTISCLNKSLIIKDPEHPATQTQLLIDKTKISESAVSEHENRIVTRILDQLAHSTLLRYGKNNWNIFLEELSHGNTKIPQAYFAAYRRTPQEMFETIKIKENDPVFSEKTSRLISEDVEIFRIFYFLPSVAQRELDLIKNIVENEYKDISKFFLANGANMSKFNSHLVNLKDQKINIYLLPTSKLFFKYSYEKQIFLYSLYGEYKRSQKDFALQMDIYIKYNGIFSFSESISGALCETFTLFNQLDSEKTRKYKLNENAPNLMQSIDWSWKNWLFIGFLSYLNEKNNISYKFDIFDSANANVINYWRRYGIEKYKDVVLNIDHIFSVYYPLLKGWKKVFYVSLAQSFVEYLISTYGMDIFMKLMHSKQWEKNYLDILKKSRKEISDQWRKSVLKSI